MTLDNDNKNKEINVSKEINDNNIIVENNVLNNANFSNGNKDLDNSNIGNNNKVNVKIVLIVFSIVSVLFILGLLFLFGIIRIYNNKLSNKVNEVIDNNFVNEIIDDKYDEEYYFDKEKVIFKDISFVQDKLSYVDNGVTVYEGINSIEKFDRYLIFHSGLYDFDGNIVFDSSNYDSVKYEEDYIIVEKNNKFGLLNNKFELIVPIEYYEIEVKSDNCIFLKNLNKKNVVMTKIFNVKVNKQYGPYLNVNYLSDNFITGDKFLGGNIEDAPSFNNIKDLETHIIDIIKDTDIVNNNSDYSFIVSKNYQNKYIILSNFISGKGFMDGVIDYNFKQIIPFEYDDIENVYDKYLLLKKDDLFDLVTIDNKKILSLKNVDYVTVENNIIVVNLENDSTLFYDSNGNLLYSFDEYISIRNLSNDKYLIGDYDKVCIYLDGVKGNNIDISFCDDFLDEGSYVVKKEETGYSLYNNKLEKIFNNNYLDIDLFDGFCFIEVDDGYYIYSYDEDKIIDISFEDYWYLGEGLLLRRKVNNDYKFYYFEYKK